MKNSLFFFILLFTFISCSKEQRVNKKLHGKWSVKIIQIEDGEGFMYFDSLPNGTIEFISNQKNINANIIYNYVNLNGYNVIDSFKLINENYVFNSKSDRIIFNYNFVLINARIILLTKKSLEFEYYDMTKYKLVRFILFK